MKYFIILTFFLGSMPIIAGEPLENCSTSEKLTFGDFPGWNRKQVIVINQNMVKGSTNLADFPFLVTLDHLDGEIVDGGANSALNGGGDIRFSSDADGNNRLAIEVVEFVTSTALAIRRCQIWVKIPSLSTTVDTTIYIWYNKAAEVQPAATDPYGSQTVWSNYDFVTHDMRTESSSGKTIILDNAAGLASGPFGSNVSDFNGTSNFHTWDPSGMGLSTQRTISFWANFDTTSTAWQRMFQLATLDTQVATQFVVSNGRMIFGTGDQVAENIPLSATKMLQGYSAGIWYRVIGSWTTLETGTDLRVNSAAATINAADNMSFGSGSQTARFGNRSDGGNFYDGKIACFTISKNLLSDDYVTTEYNNQSNPVSFASAGTPEDASQGGSGGSGSGYWIQSGSNINYTSGNVGIGTTTPGAYKLAVNGNIHTKEVKVDLVGWADYVFLKDYSLPTLEEVEKHIFEKGHLINIPSAKEVEANGIKLGEMNRLLLEKIEELTLYVIELKKENDNQQQEIESLKSIEYSKNK